MLVAIVCLGVFWVLLNVIGIAWTHWKGNEFHQKWAEGSCPHIADLQGRYKIKMYPRWLWWWFRDIKIFYHEYGGMGKEDGFYSAKEGLNVAWGIMAWGKRFAAKWRDIFVELNYERAWWPWRIIRDYVKRRKGERGLYDGMFCIKLPLIGERQLAWFTMEKL